MSDLEIPRYLRGGELAEWSRARQMHDAGQSRIAQGTSIINAPRVQNAGKGFETPAEAKARGEKMVKEGQEQVARANLTLGRLRANAAHRFAEMTKTVNDAADLPAQSWEEGLLLAAVRGVKSARDAGCARHHLVGTWSFDAQGLPQANPVLDDAFRAAWTKAQAERDLLQAIPAGGYRLAPPAADGTPPSFASGWVPPARPGDIALAWVEIHALTDEASLVFVRVADAHTLRLLASEAFLCSPNGAKPDLRGSMSLRDDRSFLPRLATQPAWRLGYPAGTPALGAAVLRHLCYRLGHVTVWADDALVGLLPGSPGPSRANAAWDLRAVPAPAAKPGVPAPAFFRAFRLASSANEQTVEVGEVALRIESAAGAKSPGG
jgi:hypothetical protein